MGLKPVLAKVRERETRGEAVGQKGAQIWGFRALDQNRAEWGHHLIGLVSVLLAVAVNSVT